MYSVSHKIERVCIDAYSLMRNLWVNSTATSAMVHVVVLGPPWGGVDYDTEHTQYNIKTMLPCGSGIELLQLASLVASRVVFILPRNVNKQQLADQAASVGLQCLLEDVYLNYKLKMVVAYFDRLFKI